MPKKERRVGVTFYPDPEVDRVLSAMPKGMRSRWINDKLSRFVVCLPVDRHYDEKQFQEAVIQVLQFYEELTSSISLAIWLESDEYKQQVADYEESEKQRKKNAKTNK